MKKLLSLLLIVTFIFSCTIEKRRYRPGYDIQWKKQVFGKIDHSSSKSDESNTNNLKKENSYSIAVIENTDEAKFLAKLDEVKKDNSVPKAIKQGSVNNIKTTQQKKQESKKKTIATTRHSKVETNKSKNRTIWLYILAPLMMLTSFGLLRKFSKLGSKLTKWSFNNPKKAKLLITGLQLPLYGLGLYTGKNYYDAGIEFSSQALLPMAGLTFLGFLTIPFFKKKHSVPTKALLNRNRFAFIGILVTSLMLSVGLGNRVGKNHSFKSFKSVYEASSIDNKTNINTSNEKQIMRVEKERVQEANKKAALAASGSVGLIILLALCICIGGCLFLGGVIWVISAFAGGGAAGLLGIVAIILGILIIKASVQGIKNNA